MPGWRLIQPPAISDPRGDLTFAEGGRHVPFAIARVYHLYNVPVDAGRGGHAHVGQEQVLVALAGEFRVTLDDGRERAEIRLRDPREGLYIPRMVWREMDGFSAGAVRLVLASHPYDVADYCRDCAAFRAAAAAEA